MKKFTEEERGGDWRRTNLRRHGTRDTEGKEKKEGGKVSPKTEKVESLSHSHSLSHSLSREQEEEATKGEGWGGGGGGGFSVTTVSAPVISIAQVSV